MLLLFFFLLLLMTALLGLSSSFVNRCVKVSRLRHSCCRYSVERCRSLLLFCLLVVVNDFFFIVFVLVNNFFFVVFVLVNDFFFVLVLGLELNANLVFTGGSLL
jgi:hypothetical protein